MSHHKIRIEFLALTPQRKALFLRWALDGFRFPKLPLKHINGAVGADDRRCGVDHVASGTEWRRASPFYETVALGHATGAGIAAGLHGDPKRQNQKPL